MSSEGYGPAPRTAGTRYCRAARRRGAPARGAPARGAFVARHSSAGIVLAKRWSPPEPEPPARRWRGLAGFTVAVAALAASMALLLAGVPAGQPETGPCTARASIEAYAAGHLLRLRAEPGAGAATLVHLCAGDSVGRVRSWAISLEDDGRTAAVQRVAERVALASVPLGPGSTPVAVTVVPESGQTLVFTTRLASDSPAGPASP